MKRVGIDIRELKKGKLTGIGRFLIEFLKKAKFYNEFEFILFGNQETDITTDVLKSYQKVIIEEKLTFFWDQVKLKNALEKNSVDIFFSPYYKIPILAKIPSIISLFDLIYLKVEPYKSQFKNKFFIKNFITLSGKKAKKILTISNYTKKDLVKFFNFPKEKIDVVYPAISTNFFKRNFSEIEIVRKKYSIDKKYLLYVGNSNPHKNLFRLIEGYNLLSKKFRDEYCLVLAGVSNFQNKNDNLKIINFIPDEDLPVLYSGASLFMFPSIYEGFGLPPLEAMACGCPVVSSNTSSMPEILGDACLYFNPYDVREICNIIEQVLENKSLQDQLREKGLQRAKLYTAEKMTNQLLNIFEKLKD